MVSFWRERESNPPSSSLLYKSLSGSCFLMVDDRESRMWRKRGICCTRRRLRGTMELREEKRKRKRIPVSENLLSKRRKVVKKTSERSDFFDRLPDDLILCILSRFGSDGKSPADFVSILATCRRLNGLGLHPMVLRNASPRIFSLKALNWTESAHRFLKRCAVAGNVEACFTLGMIRFYCLERRRSGASLMAKAAIASYAPALYALSVIQFNGSGGTKNDKDLRAGVALCFRAASLGHIDALREFGHCLQDGYGVRQNVAEGRRFLVQANARELTSVYGCTRTRPSSPIQYRAIIRRNMVTFRPWLRNLIENRWQAADCPLLSDFGCNVPPPELHPANRFLVEWFSLRPPEGGLRLCSYASCGKPETRKHEFRRCSVCGNVNYCSRACQALDWKVRHKHQCAPLVLGHEYVDEDVDDDEEEDEYDDDEEDDNEQAEGDEELASQVDDDVRFLEADGIIVR